MSAANILEAPAPAAAVPAEGRVPPARVSPSAILCHAAGIRVQSNHLAEADTACGMCGIGLSRGQACCDILKKFDDTFTNRADLVEGSRLVCMHCAAVWDESFWLSTGANGYTDGDEVVQLLSGQDKIRFLLDPPKPPFIVYQKVAQQQHMVWRSPVNWDRRRIFVRLGDEVMTLDLQKVHAAVKAWREVAQKLEALGRKHAFAMLEQKLMTPGVGAVMPDAAQMASDAGLGKQVQALDGLTAGEWWALESLRKHEEGAPLPPRRLLARSDGWRMPKKNKPGADSEDGEGGDA